MSVLQTNAFPLGYSAVTGNTGKSEAMIVIAGAEATVMRADLSISNGGIFRGGSAATGLELAVEFAGDPEDREQSDDAADDRPVVPERDAVFQGTRFGQGSDFFDEVG